MSVTREAEDGSQAGLLMGRAAFNHWALAQPHGNFGRLDGEVAWMSPERLGHSRLKTEIWRAIDAALSERPGRRVVIDGLAVQVGDATDFIPEVAIHAGPPIPRDSVTIPTPIVVVEVLSQSTQLRDAATKIDR